MSVSLHPTATSQQQAEEVIDLRQYFTVIMRAKWRIISLAILTTILAVFVVLSMTPIYKSTATLLIESQQAKAIGIEEVYGINSGQKEYYLTQFEILKSRSIAERVFDQLDLANHPDFIPKPSAMAKLRQSIDFLPAPSSELSKEQTALIKRHALLDDFMARLTISPVRKTQLVQVSFETPDAKLAATVANAIGEAYIASQLEAKLGITQKANTWLGSQLGDLRSQLDDSERRLETFRHKHNLIDVEGITTLDAQELANLNESLVKARSDADEANAFLAMVQRYGKNDLARLESLPEITSHKLIQDVKKDALNVERKVSELSKVYGPKHPKMKAAMSEMESVKANLRTQINRLVQGIEEEANTATQNVTALQAQFNKAKAGFSQLSTIETEYRRLTREVQTNRQLFNNFLARQKETAVTGDLDTPVARFTDRAVVTVEPVKPNKKLIVMLVFVATIGLGVVLAFVLDALNDTIKSSHDVEQVLAQRSLGQVPKIDKKLTVEQRDNAYFDTQQKLFAESVRSIRTSLSLLALDKPAQVIEVTSSLPGEGKTSTSLNLAYALSALERVLIIDADMRKPTLGIRLNVANYQAGLANCLAHTEQLDECIVQNVKQNIDVMPAGNLPLNPLELLSSPGFNTLLEELKTRYDKIVIDTAPVQAVSDALILAPKVDATILVAKANATRSSVIKNSLAKLNQSHAKVFGVVLNQFDVKEAQSYYGNYGYYEAYGNAEQAPTKPSNAA
jgi:capsular exopolysaccharide synthesis family protein